MLKYNGLTYTRLLPKCRNCEALGSKGAGGVLDCSDDFVSIHAMMDSCQ
jgi:hypothetical protein